MEGIFEIRHQDVAGRIGDLRVPRADRTIETPALLPVINPNRLTIDPGRFGGFGVEMLITNAYIIREDDDLREAAISRGLHDLLGFDGPIMTDSGSFQLAEYGEIDVTTAEILTFQHEIGSDVGTPVDIPTPPDADRETAERDLAKTQDRLSIAESIDVGEMLVTGPVQGSTFTDLRERAGRDAAERDLDVFPIGGMVPLLNAYRYAEMVDVVAAAKRGLGDGVPVHLFGAGHPMTFALAVALGCDLFDSAAYALYAREDRYLTVEGTKQLSELSYFPCGCAVCRNHDPDDLRAMDEPTRTRRLAEHNLAVSQAEMAHVKQAIRDGSLLELVERRIRAHPRLLDGYRTLLDHAAQLERADPASKSTFFYLSAESARRPEVLRHHERLARLDPTGPVLLTEGGNAGDFEETWRLVPLFGPVPRQLSKTYPLTAEIPARMDDAGYEAAAEGVRRLVEANPEVEFTLAHRDWPSSAMESVPDRVTVTDLDTVEARGSGWEDNSPGRTQ